MKCTAVALIDGEHYPAVVVEALQRAGKRFEVRAALFLGGSEKIRAAAFENEAASIYGLPVLFDEDHCRGLARVIADYRPEVVVDLSDEPVLGYEQRFRLVSEALAQGVSYEGPDFHFSPTTSARLCTSPSLSIVGIGKRVGKTAVSGYVVRALQGAEAGREGAGPAGAEQEGTASVDGAPRSSPAVVVVAMGRGGPAQPEVIDGASTALTVRDLLTRSRQGWHAASDYFEAALMSRVITVGCRRCGGGMAGEPFLSNVAEGVLLANGLNPGLIVLEGSGAAFPPVASDAQLLVAGAHQAVGSIAGYLGAYRLLVSDALVLTMAEEPLAPPDKVRMVRAAVEEVKPGMTVVPVVFRPRPLEDVSGRRVAFFSTAPASQEGLLRRCLEERWGCKVEVFSAGLADRAALEADLASEGMSRVEVILTEIKAAAIDMVAEAGDSLGLPVVAVDNQPEEAALERPGRLAELARELEEMARVRFEGRE